MWVLPHPTSTTQIIPKSQIPARGAALTALRPHPVPSRLHHTSQHMRPGPCPSPPEPPHRTVRFLLIHAPPPRQTHHVRRKIALDLRRPSSTTPCRRSTTPQYKVLRAMHAVACRAPAAPSLPSTPACCADAASALPCSNGPCHRGLLSCVTCPRLYAEGALELPQAVQRRRVGIGRVRQPRRQDEHRHRDEREA